MTSRRNLILGTPALACALALYSGPALADETSVPSLPPAVQSMEFIYQDAPYPQSHASTIVQTRSGTIAAAWFGGTHERHPDVEIWFARRDAAGWGKPVSVADGVQPDGSRLPTWNPVLFQDPAGRLLLYYKVGPSPQDWWGMLVTSDDDGATWSDPIRLPDGVLGPIKNKPVILPDGTWLSPSSTEIADGGGWKLHFERSTDAGRSWTVVSVAEERHLFDAIQPSVLFLPDGRLEAVARTRQGVVAATFSADNGLSWSAPMPIDLPNPNSGTDAATLADGRQLIVYNHAAHSPDTPGKGLRYPINIGLSDDGVRWRNVLTLEDAPLQHGYAYPAVIQARDGKVHITYTYDRRRIRHVVVDPAKL